MASSGLDGGGPTGTNNDDDDDDPHHTDHDDRAARCCAATNRHALSAQAMHRQPSAVRTAALAVAGRGEPVNLAGDTLVGVEEERQALPLLTAADVETVNRLPVSLPMHLQEFHSVSTGPGQSSIFLTHAPQDNARLVQQQQQQQHQQQQQRQHFQQHLPHHQHQHQRIQFPTHIQSTPAIGDGSNTLLGSSADPFLDSLASFEQEHGMILWDAWGNSSPSNLFASNSPPGVRPFSGMGGNIEGGGGGDGSSQGSSSNSSRGGINPFDSGGIGIGACNPALPPPPSSTAHRALPPLPSANAQRHPLPVQRTGSFDLPLVPPLMRSRHAGRSSIVRSELNPYGGFIERETPPLLRSRSGTDAEGATKIGAREELGGGGGEDASPAAFVEHRESTAGATPVPYLRVDQWRTGQAGNRETIQSLLDAIPNVPPLAAPPLGAPGAMVPRSYSEIRPMPSIPTFQRSMSAPLGSLAGGGGDGCALAAQPRGLGSSASVEGFRTHSVGSSHGSGMLAFSMSEDLSRSFSYGASNRAETESAVRGSSHGAGLNVPFSDMDEAARREYRRQKMLRWLEKRKRHKVDRGIAYSERSTLANRRQRISGRFVKQNSPFVSITELDRTRTAGGVDGSGDGVAGPGKDEEDDDEDEEDDDDSKHGEDDVR